MLLLEIFCPECTPWLLLMLLGAWLLGWLFWGLIKGTNYRIKIKGIEEDLTRSNEQNTKLKEDLSSERYAHEKLSGNHKDLRNKYDQLDLNHKVEKEKLGNEIADLQQQIADLRGS